jgi:protein-S-isoprenylcysteine O-methyltransferase Ste14
VRPLVYEGGAASVAFFAAVVLYSVAEGVLQARTQTEARDPSRTWMVVGSLAGLALAFVVAGEDGHLPGPDWLPVAVGLALMVAGTALRYWSVATLGRFFTVTVEVGEDHELVERGPYALLRHPSYTGMLVVYLGIGVALDSWLSVAAAVLIPAAAVVNRIAHEERLLREQLGASYVHYQDRTKRLVPGLW